ncbi:MAG: 5-formyltetrahydrofolate cyclo-ligase [Methyloligellaceae bacterium]
MREHALLERTKLAAATRGRGAEAIARTGLSFLDIPPGAVIAGFAAIRDELDPLALLEALAGEGHTIVLPAVIARDAPLEFRVWRPGDPLEKQAFGVPTPGHWAAKLDPDVVLAPLAAFDRDGYRLGYGGGYYDRTLAGLRETRDVVAVGVAFESQEVDSVPHDNYDQRLDWILTPSGAFAT